MDIIKYKVELTYDELILLDGKVSDEAQRVVDAAKFDKTLKFELPLIGKLIREAVETGGVQLSVKTN